jgi:hypothetical protein
MFKAGNNDSAETESKKFENEVEWMGDEDLSDAENNQI